MKFLSKVPPALGVAVLLASITFAQVLATPSNIYSVLFVDNSHGWAVGLNGTILMTSNSGVTWKPQASGTSRSHLFSVYFADASHGWAVALD
jgi:photosystem II stability/assembly factor-like uncharacterized protein